MLKFVPHYEDEESNDGLPFLVGGRERVSLPPEDLGPRAITMVGRKIYTANYFSDTLSAIDLDGLQPLRPVSLALGPKRKLSRARKGELYFNDARLCFQGWQSCASCHPGDARVDALNWDLPNDGLGNPKNTGVYCWLASFRRRWLWVSAPTLRLPSGRESNSSCSPINRKRFRRRWSRT